MLPYDPDLALMLQGSDRQQQKDEATQISKKQLDAYPNAAKIQNQNQIHGSPIDHISSTPSNTFPHCTIKAR